MAQRQAGQETGLNIDVNYVFRLERRVRLPGLLPALVFLQACCQRRDLSFQPSLASPDRKD